MALIELYRTTGKRQYVELAGYILHGDERSDAYSRATIVYMFCGIPFTTRTKLEGHAVRAMYACCGATDYYLETGDPAYLEDAERSLGRSVEAADVHHRRRRCAQRRAKLSAKHTNCPTRRLTAKAARPSAT